MDTAYQGLSQTMAKGLPDFPTAKGTCNRGSHHPKSMAGLSHFLGASRAQWQSWNFLGYSLLNSFNLIPA